MTIAVGGIEAQLRAAAIERRKRLMYVPPIVKKCPSLTLVKPELIVQEKPEEKINIGGRPRKQKTRPQANSHVYAWRVYHLQNKARRTSLEHAKMLCAAAFVEWEVLISPSRRRDMVPLRNRIAWELRQRGLSYPQIGSILNRDHTAIIHCVRKVDAESGDKEASKWIKRKQRQALEGAKRQMSRKGKA